MTRIGKTRESANLQYSIRMNGSEAVISILRTGYVGGRESIRACAQKSTVLKLRMMMIQTCKYKEQKDE